MASCNSHGIEARLAEQECSLLRVISTAASIQVIVSYKLIHLLHQIDGCVRFCITLQTPHQSVERLFLPLIWQQSEQS